MSMDLSNIPIIITGEYSDEWEELNISHEKLLNIIYSDVMFCVFSEEIVAVQYVICSLQITAAIKKRKILAIGFFTFLK